MRLGGRAGGSMAKGLGSLAAALAVGLSLPAAAAAPSGSSGTPPSSTPPSSTATSSTTGTSNPGTTTTPTVPTSGSVPGPSPATTQQPSAPTVDLAAITADQQALLRQDHQAAIAADQRAVGSAETALAHDQQTLAADDQRATDTEGSLQRARQARGQDQAAEQRAAAQHRAAQAAVADDDARIRAVAVQLYEGTSQAPAAAALPVPVPDAGGLQATPSLGLPPSLQQAQEDQAGQVYLTSALNAINRTAAADVRRDQQAARAEQTLAADVEHDQAALADAQRGASDAAEQVRADQGAVFVDGLSASGAQQRLAGDQAALSLALAALGGPPLAKPRAAGDESPSILGPSVLTAAQLTTWFNGQGYVDQTTTPVPTFAQWYLVEGQAEGVRGDIAFAQAVLETGGFASPDATGANNYAGIGHCDLCPSGFSFPSPQLGVRGQIQLLRAYADPGLTSTQLADPPAIAEVAPEGQPARGCCGTWESLTGVWASSPVYGDTILSLYLSMLSSALGGTGAPGATTTTTTPGAPPALAPPAR